MQLSIFSDYALRTLMHLAAAEDNLLSTRQIAEIHGAKYNHLAKVTHWLSREGYVRSVRGRSGGLQLAIPAQDISVGEVLRKLESEQVLVECLRDDGGLCVLSPMCGLTEALKNAKSLFFGALDGVSISSLTSKRSKMSRLLKTLNSEAT